MAAACIVVMYHYVRDTEKTPFPDIKALSVADFECQLSWLQERYTVISYSTFEQYVASRTGPEEPTALLTFDDGFIDHYEVVFPLLKERGLSGVFFVCDSTIDPEPPLFNAHKIHFVLAKIGAEAFTEEVRQVLAEQKVALEERERKGLYRYDELKESDIKKLLNYELPYEVADNALDQLVERHLGDSVALARSLYLSADQIREMAAGGMTFGPHTRNHRVLSRLSVSEQREQLRNGAQLIRDLTGQKTVPFCYPYGHRHTYNANTIRILKSTGHALAFNTVRAPVRFDQDSLYELPRFDTKDLPPFTDLTSNA